MKKQTRSRNSKPKQPSKGFVFTVVEDDGKNVTIEVSREDYEREKAEGVEEEFF
jgi:hypothetical protein